jgi:hypothetical protein
MAQKFLKTVFASQGDFDEVPDAVQPGGAVSYAEGFGPDYEGNLQSDPNALPIGRADFNGLMHDVTAAIQQYQTTGAPEWITSADNGGVPYPYEKSAMVRYFDTGLNTWGVYTSLVDNNTAVPTNTVNWAPQLSVPELMAVFVPIAGNVTLTGPLALAAGTTAPTVNVADNSTKLATTAYVVLKTAQYVPISGGVTMTGPLALATGATAVTPLAGDNTTKVATAQFVQSNYVPLVGNVTISGPLHLPALSTVPTPLAGDNSTTIANTAFIVDAVSNAGLGYGQTWTQVTAAINVAYQNTTAKPIMVIGSNFNGDGGSPAGLFSISNDNVNWIDMPSNRTFVDFTNGINSYMPVIIPPGHYYRTIGSNTPTVTYYILS